MACGRRQSISALQTFFCLSQSGAKRALEDKIGTMLPCNVIVQELADGRVEVAAIDPVASMQAIDNPRLKEAAAQVAEQLKRVIAKVGR